MIASFRSKALERFWIKGETRRVDPKHVARLTLILTVLDHAVRPEDLNLPGWGFHLLSGGQAGRYAVKVGKNWRVTFAWSEVDADAIDADYEDYH